MFAVFALHFGVKCRKLSFSARGCFFALTYQIFYSFFFFLNSWAISSKIKCGSNLFLRKITRVKLCKVKVFIHAIINGSTSVVCVCVCVSLVFRTSGGFNELLETLQLKLS